MPRPIFDIEQYELRGHKPQVFTRKQKDSLAQTLSRANGQIDWAAQLLGFHGDKTWGRPVPTIDGDYNWQGLPETMNEKRQLQVGAFGIYNKNQSYESWPAPFNRSQIRASGDATISIFEENGETVAAPYGQRDLVNYSHDPIVYVGAEYEFDVDLDIQLAGEGDIDEYATQTNFFVNDQKWTRVLITRAPQTGFNLKIKGSTAKILLVNTLEWTDSSDWNVDQVRRQFLGVWGNKGASLSLDFSFDALDLHGFDEQNGLSQASPIKSMTPELLLWTVGLKPTIWTPFETKNFGFKFGDCPISYPATPLDPDTFLLRDEVHTFSSCFTDCSHYVEMRQIRGTENEDCDFTVNNILSSDPDDDFLITDPELIEIEFEDGQCQRSPLVVPGVESFEIEFKALKSCGQIGDPCVEWIFDPTLDNGDWEAQYYLPDNPGPWAIADDGEYESLAESPTVFSGQTLAQCEYTNQWTGFDDGYFDALLQPDCLSEPCVIGDSCFCYDMDGEEVTFWRNLPAYNEFQDGGIIRLVGPCTIADSGTMTTPTVPILDDDCAVECSILENGTIVSGSTVYTGPIIVSGGLFPLDPSDPNATTLLFCVTDASGAPINYIGCDADNCVYTYYTSSDACSPTEGGYYAAGSTPDYSGCDCLVECCGIDNGQLIVGRFIYTGPELNDGGWYDLPDVDPTIPGVACPVIPLRVNLIETLYSSEYSMLPSLRNTSTPLRVWKNQVLTVPEDVPAEGTEFWNPLVADENRGPEEEADYRYYIRLPLEYQRNGKEWNRAVSVCDNQSYFSALPELSQTHDEPDVIRPVLFAEDYWRNFYEDSVTYYDEDYLVSNFREDPSLTREKDFEDSKVGFELDTPLPYAFANVEEYDPFGLRAPNLDGSWRGKYYVNGVNPERTGTIENDLESYNLIQLSDGQEPIYDKSAIELPTIDFPDSPAKASLKNYVVCYAYFVTDFSGADDAIFDPEKQQCWRAPVLDCDSSPDCSDPANVQFCQTGLSLKSNTAYRLHEYGPATSSILLS